MGTDLTSRVGVGALMETMRCENAYGQSSGLSGAEFDQLSRLFVGMTRTRRSWEAEPAACKLFHALAQALDQAAEAAHEPIAARRRLADVGRVAHFYREIDQAQLRGPLKWRPQVQWLSGLPRLLTPLVMAFYIRRLASVLTGPVAYQPIADEIEALQATAFRAAAMAAQTPVTTISAVPGEMISDGALRIVGTFDGNIRCQSLDVSAGAAVYGTIVAETVTVLGSVYGTIYAGHLTLAAGSHVEADLFHGALVVEGDTYFEGKSRRHPNPAELVPVGWSHNTVEQIQLQ